MTENSFSQDSPTLDVVLAQTIARHFRGATTETIDDVQTVRLGEGLPIIECFIDEIQDHEPYGAFLFLQISGGAFGSRRVLVTASGYGSSQLASVVTAGRNWACAFGPVLLTGIDRPDLIDSDNPDVELFEATVGGRRYRVATGHLDRSMNMPIEEVEAYRRRLGGPRALTDRVLASPLIPATRSDEAVALGCYAAIGPRSITELKFAGADWPAGRSVLDAIPPEPGGHRMLREWSVLTPLEPAPDQGRAPAHPQPHRRDLPRSRQRSRLARQPPPRHEAGAAEPSCGTLAAGGPALVPQHHRGIGRRPRLRAGHLPGR